MENTKIEVDDIDTILTKRCVAVMKLIITLQKNAVVQTQVMLETLELVE